jgi:ubiquinone/menaquinone biosynthesis C-methylase UbiE
MDDYALALPRFAKLLLPLHALLRNRDGHHNRRTENAMMSSANIDATTFKAAMRAQWDKSADGWNDNTGLIRAWLNLPTDAMLAMADLRTGMRVLDVAAGAGDQSLDIAEQVGQSGSVLATDLSPAILACATANAAARGLRNIETHVADAEDLDLEDAAFDAVICRLGLMLMPNPVKALAEMHRVLRPGGKAAAMVFSSPDRNPCVGILVSTAMKHAGLPPRDPYQPGGLMSLGKPGLLDELFRAAGFSDVSTTKVAAPMRLPSVEHYLDFIRTSASPILQIIAGMDDGRKNAVWAEIADRLDTFSTPDGWVGPNELLLTVGQR